MTEESTQTPRSFARKTSFALIAIGLGTLFALTVAEIVCRMLPVATGSMAQPVNASSPIFRFTPNREYLWSVGPRFALVNRGWVNNDGFINDQDYDPDDSRPLLAVVGDSYVEALMVPYRETLQGRLQRCVGSDGRVYSFASSGAPLSQYLIWAKYARERYRAQSLAFVVVGNDFDESLAKYKTGPGFHHFVDDGSGGLELRLFEYSPASLRKVVRRSAFARFLVFNLHIEWTLRQLWAKLVPGAKANIGPEYVGNTAAASSDERLEDSMRAVHAFFDALPAHAGLDASDIVFLIDGTRPALYSGAQGLDAVKSSYFPRMRRRFMQEARARGYRVIDLETLFVARHQADGSKFEFKEDAHWNGTGHEVAAAALLRSDPVRALFRDAALADDCPTLVGDSES